MTDSSRTFDNLDPDPPSSPVDVYDVLDPPDWREVEDVKVSGNRL
jgi:hypothetical protein